MSLSASKRSAANSSASVASPSAAAGSSAGGHNVESDEGTFDAQDVGHLLKPTGVVTIMAMVLDDGSKRAQGFELEKGTFNAARSRSALRHAFFADSPDHLILHHTGVARNDNWRLRALPSQARPETVPQFGPVVS